MSLLEDVFLEDEANEAQELERIIDGDEYDDRPRSRLDSNENSEREDEAEEDKKRVDPTSTKTRRVIKNPRFILNPARLTGPRGIHVIPEHFKDFKFKGKGHEKEDLDLVLKKLEHWAYRLYPKFKFDDCLKKIETLGKKRPVMVNLIKIRSGQLSSEETVVQKDSSDDEAQEPPPEDEFDKLLQQQIELARSTPAPDSAKKIVGNAAKDNSFSSLIMPKATSSPSISDEQRERILRSRKLAEERRVARLQNTTNTLSNNVVTEISKNDSNTSSNNIENDTENEKIIRRVNKRNVIDSSDEEDSVLLMNETIEVNVHRQSVDNTKHRYSNVNESAHCDDITNTDESLKKNNDVEINIGSVSENNCNIDSSDEDNDIVLMNNKIEVNVHKHTVDNVKHNSLVVNDDITNNDDKPDKDDLDLNKSDVSNNRMHIDHDDDDVSINESVNVHNTNTHAVADIKQRSFDGHNDVIAKNDGILEKVLEKDDEIIKDNIKDTDDTDTVSEDIDEHLKSNKNNTQVNIDDLDKDNVEIKEKKDTVIDNAMAKNGETTVPLDDVDDLMDVDFTDDF